MNTFDYKNNSKRIPNHEIIQEIPKNPEQIKKYICQFCNKQVTTNSNLHKHEKICKKKNDIIAKMNEKIKEKDAELIELKKKLEENNKQLVEIKPRGTVARFIIENFKDAPPLRYDGYKLSEDDIKIMMHTGAVKGLCSIIEKIYICGIIAKNRSLWCTDMSRLKYYIKMTCGNSSKWILEQYGLTVITPCIKDIINQVTSYYVSKYGHQRNKSNEELFYMNKMNILLQELNTADTDKKVMQEIAGKCTIDACLEINEKIINDLKKNNNLLDIGDSEDDIEDENE